MCYRSALAARGAGTPPAAALRTQARALLLGVLWGWLPCGLVYSVLLAAALAGGPAAGALTLLGFGLGTLPAMRALSCAGGWLPRCVGLAARLLGALLIACGIWTAIAPVAILSGLHEHPHHANIGLLAPELPAWRKGTPEVRV